MDLDTAFPETQQQYLALEEIDRQLQRGELNAFGTPGQRQDIMRDVGEIKSKQLEIFHKLTDLELPLEIKLKTEAQSAQQNFNSQAFCENFQRAFHEKDEQVHMISEDLGHLCGIVDRINRKTQDLTVQQGEEEEGKGGAAGAGGSGGGGAASVSGSSGAGAGGAPRAEKV